MLGMAVIATGDAQRAVARTIPDSHDDPEVTTLLLLLGMSSCAPSFRCADKAWKAVDDKGDDVLATSPRAIVGATKATTLDAAMTTTTTTTTRWRNGDDLGMMMSNLGR